MSEVSNQDSDHLSQLSSDCSAMRFSHILNCCGPWNEEYAREKEGKSAYKRVPVTERVCPTPSSRGKLMENTMRNIANACKWEESGIRFF